jgi:hypothetical protein
MREPTGINKRHSTNAGIRFILDLDSHRRPERIVPLDYTFPLPNSTTTILLCVYLGCCRIGRYELTTVNTNAFVNHLTCTEVVI